MRKAEPLNGVVHQEPSLPSPLLRTVTLNETDIRLIWLMTEQVSVKGDIVEPFIALKRKIKSIMDKEPEFMYGNNSKKNNDGD